MIIYLISSISSSHDHIESSRQLPCRTFVSSGACPYRERCVYLHDPRLVHKGARTLTRKKNKEDIVQDSLFWYAKFKHANRIIGIL